MAKSRTNEIDLAAGRTLKILRKRSGFTQKKLASAMGLSFQQIQKYEQGQSRISIGNLIRICAAMGISPHEFLKTLLHAPEPPSLEILP